MCVEHRCDRVKRDGRVRCLEQRRRINRAQQQRYRAKPTGLAAHARYATSEAGLAARTRAYLRRDRRDRQARMARKAVLIEQLEAIVASWSKPTPADEVAA